MNFSDNFFKRIEKKTNVDKNTILDLSKMTGREVSKEKEQKIIETILNDKVPNNLDKMI